MMLQVENLSAGYGSLNVLDRVSLGIEESEVVALFGHNGAGKTTLLKAIFGLLDGIHGEMRFRGESILNTSPKARTSRGIAYVPQGRGVFANLTVAENLRLGLFAAGISADSTEGKRRFERVFQHLPLLRERLHERAGRLSGGQQQMVSIGRALALSPSLLLMDEPSIGLSPRIVQEVMQLVRRLREEAGLAVLLVEQNVRQALRVAQRVYVMKAGTMILESTPKHLTELKSLWELF
jgi:branched-chain amino acid transport system ATP-binding protein